MSKTKFLFEDQYDMIKSNHAIKDLLYHRFIIRDMSLQEICDDAANYGVKIDASALNKFLRHRAQIKGTLRHDQIVFLCKRWGVELKLIVEFKPAIDKLKFKDDAKAWLEKIEYCKRYYEEEGCKLDRGAAYPIGAVPNF